MRTAQQLIEVAPEEKGPPVTLEEYHWQRLAHTLKHVHPTIQTELGLHTLSCTAMTETKCLSIATDLRQQVAVLMDLALRLEDLADVLWDTSGRAEYQEEQQEIDWSELE